MTNRERFKAIINFQPIDRLPVLEWAEWWDQTIDRWYEEGLPKNLTDRYSICQHFGLDIYKQDWISICTPECPKEKEHGYGIITSKEEYEKILPFLYPENSLDTAKWEQWAKEQESGDVVLWFTIDGFFWFPRKLLGIERHMYAFYDQPELIQRINQDLTEWMLKTVDQLSSICSPDFMTFAEDMSYNHGPMLSENLFDEYMLPYYEKIIPTLKEHNILPVVDSDGDISVATKWFEKAGIKGILPLERQASLDIETLRKQNPNMCFIGHFDKRVMNKGEAAIRDEFERLLPTVAKGGYLICCDHQTPPEVSYQDYKLYISLFKEYAEKAGEMSNR